MSQTPDENRILALNPPFVLGQTDLKKDGYDGVIALETVEHDLRVVVDPWVGMALNDGCKMFCDGVEVGTILIDESNVNKRLEFKVPKAQVTNGGAQIVYTVERSGQEPVSSEPLRNVWAQLTQPGDTGGASEADNSCLTYTLSPEPPNVLVDLNSRLPAPVIRVNNDSVTSIDLKVLGSNDAAVRVCFTAPHYQPDDKVVLTWAGTTSGGQPLIVGPLEKTIDSVPGQYDFPMPNAMIAAISNGSAKVAFQLLRAGVPARSSNDVVVTVIGEVSQLKPPALSTTLVIGELLQSSLSMSGLGGGEGAAIGGRARSNRVNSGLDDLTTFEKYDLNHWATNREDLSHPKISYVANEYFLESVPGPSAYSAISIVKSFQEIDTGIQLEFSFDYKATAPISIEFYQNHVKVHGESATASPFWQSRTLRFAVAQSRTPRSLMLFLFAGGALQPTFIKNLRLKNSNN